jgi:tetratricopeptide (TPR) repeat protein
MSVFTIAALAAWATLALRQEPPQPVDAPQPIVESTPAVDPFERRVADLPRAAPERWKGFVAAVEAGTAETFVARELMVRHALAEQHYGRDDFRSALTELYAVLEAEPDFPPSLIVLGTALFRLRRYGDAASAFERFVEVAPEQVFRTQALAHCYYSLGDYARSKVHYERVIAAGAQSLEALRGLALACWRLGDDVRALELLDQVLAVDADHVEALQWKAQVLFERGDHQLALHLAERAGALAPHDPRPLFLQSRCLFELERDDEAERVRLRWRELDALTQNVRRIEGRLPFERAPYGLAIELAELCRRTKDVESARSAMAVAERSRPADVPLENFHVYALDLLYEIGDFDGARLAAIALERNCPDSIAGWKRLELFYAQIRDRKRQIEAGERWRRLSGGE